MSLISDMKIDWHMFKIIKSKNNLRNLEINKKIHSKDFSNLDLSNCDLSLFSFEYWKDANIENTNFSNSKINFTPKYLPGKTKHLKNVNFENVDLSYLTDEDFYSVCRIENCNFYNTGLKANITSYDSREPFDVKMTLIKNVKFDKETVINSKACLDIKTIELNENYSFLDGQIIYAIIEEIRKQDPERAICAVVNNYRNDKDIYEMFGISLNEYYKKIDEYINKLIKYLERYKKNKLINLINKLRKNMDLIDLFAFLTSYNTRMDLHFKNIDFSKEDLEIIINWFKFCTVEKGYNSYDRYHSLRKKVFENCTFDTSYIDAFEFPIINRDTFLLYQTRIKGCEFINCSFSNNSFQNEGKKKGLILPNFSCNTSTYIKLGNMCNGKCNFCKNNTETKKETNVENIIKSLTDERILTHLNQVYFGGGEPTLYLDEIKKIIIEHRKIAYKKQLALPKYYMFTNGACDWEKIEKFMEEIYEYYKKLDIIISRQDIENENNKKIIGLDCSLDDPYLKELLNKKRILFALTCNEMNMRENFLMDYLKFGNEIGVRNFIIQDLESKTGIEVPFIEEYLKEFEQYLISKGFKKTRIVSSSYFDMNLFKSKDNTVALKRYFKPSELEERFKYCAKHSFDLAIDSNGEIYHDYQMIKKLK